MVDCGMKVVKANGFMGLYSGSLPLILGSSAKQSARWGAYTFVSDQLKDEKGKLTVPANMFAGVCAGASEAILAVTPIETIKTRVADAQRKGTPYAGSLDATIKIVKAEGPLGIYRGVVPTILKQSTNQMVRFPFQSFFMDLLVGDNVEKRKNPLINGIAGALAGGASVLVTMPQDTVKTRMQGEDAKKLYKGTVDCFMKILRQEGPAFFFAGTVPRLVRVSLDVGITFTIYPLLSKFI
jgi:solute carrier family 25 citrate transporter 1